MFSYAVWTDCSALPINPARERRATITRACTGLFRKSYAKDSNNIPTTEQNSPEWPTVPELSKRLHA
jgi:hypothetical protein